MAIALPRVFVASLYGALVGSGNGAIENGVPTRSPDTPSQVDGILAVRMRVFDERIRSLTICATWRRGYRKGALKVV